MAYFVQRPGPSYSGGCFFYFFHPFIKVPFHLTIYLKSPPTPRAHSRVTTRRDMRPSIETRRNHFRVTDYVKTISHLNFPSYHFRKASHAGLFSPGCLVMSVPSFRKNKGPKRGLNVHRHTLPLLFLPLPQKLA